MALSLRSQAVTVSIIALLSAAGAAQAATFSFASDDDSGAFTLVGIQSGPSAFQIRNGRTPAFTPLTLQVDDDNNALPTISIAVGLLVDLTATYAGSIGVGAQTHVYDLTGSFSFVRASDSAVLLSAQVNSGAQLTIGGTGTTWGSAGSMFGSDSAGGPNGVNYDTNGLASHLASLAINPLQYGIWFSNIDEDFSFTMSMVNSDGGAVAIDPSSRIPSAWQSEASFSGHSVGVPAPGAAASLGLAVFTLSGRRRRR